MMENLQESLIGSKFLYVGFVLFNVLAVSFLHSSSILLALLLLTTGSLLIALEKNKKLPKLYIIAAIVGPLFEATAIHFGAWIYAKPDLIGIPLWLPFLWGNAALAISKAARTSS